MTVYILYCPVDWLERSINVDDESQVQIPRRTRQTAMLTSVSGFTWALTTVIVCRLHHYMPKTQKANHSFLFIIARAVQFIISKYTVDMCEYSSLVSSWCVMYTVLQFPC
jgi:hypothetical protein